MEASSGLDWLGGVDIVYVYYTPYLQRNNTTMQDSAGKTDGRHMNHEMMSIIPSKWDFNGLGSLFRVDESSETLKLRGMFFIYYYVLRT